MHARFGLQPAIGIVALDQQRGRFDARRLAFAFLDQLQLVAMPLGPARVHAQQHGGPVLAFGAAGAGMDFEIAVIAVGFARQHGFQPHLFGALGQREDGVLGVGHHGGVVFGFRHFDQPRASASSLVEPWRRRRATLSSFWRSRISFCAACGSFQMAGVFGLGVQLVQAAAGDIPVKDASSAGRWPAGSRRWCG